MERHAKRHPRTMACWLCCQRAEVDTQSCLRWRVATPAVAGRGAGADASAAGSANGSASVDGHASCEALWLCSTALAVLREGGTADACDRDPRLEPCARDTRDAALLDECKCGPLPTPLLPSLSASESSLTVNPNAFCSNSSRCCKRIFARRCSFVFKYRRLASGSGCAVSVGYLTCHTKPRGQSPRSSPAQA